MGTDTDSDVVALARMIRGRCRRLERDMLELRGLASRLLETVDESETEKRETDNGRQDSNGRAAAAV